MTDLTQALFTLESRAFVPFKTFGAGYSGDGRGFSCEADADSRVHAIATLMPRKGAVTDQRAYSDTTHGPHALLGPYLPDWKSGSRARRLRPDSKS
jgi:hypothetical protein